MKRNNLKKLILTALLAALIAVCSLIQIPFTVSFTLQTFAVALAGLLLGPVYSMLSVFIYVLLGITGLPIFSGFNAGFTVFFSPTGGYILGFFALTFMGGLFSKLFKDKTVFNILGLFIGLIICYITGSVWFTFIYCDRFTLSNYFSSLVITVLPFILPDIIKILLATFLANRIKRGHSLS